ncbi:MAG TPA: phosphotransferase [Micromonosporaceae bacterium]|nr:phosphotransferase [Micromonosporaceae bacterium]
MIDDPPLDLVAAGEPAEALTHNPFNAATAGIWRVTTAAGPRVLKIAMPGTEDGTLQWGTSTDPTHFNYWQREPLAYRSGLVASAYGDAGLRGPALLDSIDRPDGSIALWLEYVSGEPGATWTIAEVRDFAARLGAAQARWLDRPLPYPWLSRDWLRQYAARRPLTATVDWGDPVLAEAWPAELRVDLARLAASRDALLTIADRLPRTLAHLDVWPMNLIWAADGPVLLDWSFIGDGAVGEDIGNLIVDSVADGLVAVSMLDQIREAAIDGYLVGIGSAVDADVVRRGVAAAGAAKYAAFGATIARKVAEGPSVGSLTYDVGGSIAELLERWRPMLTMLVDWGRSALK